MSSFLKTEMYREKTASIMNVQLNEFSKSECTGVLSTGLKTSRF